MHHVHSHVHPLGSTYSFGFFSWCIRWFPSVFHPLHHLHCLGSASEADTPPAASPEGEVLEAVGWGGRSKAAGWPSTANDDVSVWQFAEVCFL